MLNYLLHTTHDSHTDSADVPCIDQSWGPDKMVAVLQLPSDVTQHQDVQQLYQEVQSYQQHFVELHRATTAAAPTGEDPAALKAKLVQMDSHKQQLQDKLSKIRGKVQAVANLAVLQVCPWLQCVVVQDKGSSHQSELMIATAKISCT